MKQARANFAALIVEYDDEYFIYVFGGQSNDTALKHCERYNPTTNRWDRIADLHESHWQHSVI